MLTYFETELIVFRTKILSRSAIGGTLVLVEVDRKHAPGWDEAPEELKATVTRIVREVLHGEDMPTPPIIPADGASVYMDTPGEIYLYFPPGTWRDSMAEEIKKLCIFEAVTVSFYVSACAAVSESWTSLRDALDALNATRAQTDKSI